MAELPKSSTVSSSDSDEPELTPILQTSPSKKSKCSNLGTQLSKLEKNNSLRNDETPVDVKGKRKRKRKRKSKNKNKLNANTTSQATVDTVVNATPVLVRNKDNKEDNRSDRSTTINGAEHGLKNHIYFDDAHLNCAPSLNRSLRQDDPSVQHKLGVYIHHCLWH